VSGRGEEVSNGAGGDRGRPTEDRAGSTPVRLPAPGPSYLKPLELRPGGPFLVGISSPQTMAEDWWVALLWCERDGALATFDELAPEYGVPPGSPLLRLGPGVSGELSGFILEEGGRQQLRLRLGQPPEDEERPWEAPIAILAGIRFEPARVATLRPNEVALTVLRAFRDGLLRLSY
jgi:hypothetical protein